MDYKNNIKILLEMMKDVRHYYRSQITTEPMHPSVLVGYLQDSFFKTRHLPENWVIKFDEMLTTLQYAACQDPSPQRDEQIESSVCIIDSLLDHELHRLEEEGYKDGNILHILQTHKKIEEDFDFENETQDEMFSFEDVLKIVNDSCTNYKNKVISLEQLQQDFSWASDVLRDSKDETVKTFFSIIQKVVEYLQTLMQSKETLLFFCEEKNARSFILMMLGMVEIKCIEWGAL